MNSIKQEALKNICCEYFGFERLEKIWETAYDQGVADERKRAAGEIRDYKTGTPNLDREEQRIQDLLEEIATVIERGV